MARVRMVTRTVNVTEVNCLTVNTVTKEVANTIYKISGATYTEETALKAIKKQCETDTVKVVSVVGMAEYEECFGMLETEFLKYAKKLDADTRKVLAEDED